MHVCVQKKKKITALTVKFSPLLLALNDKQHFSMCADKGTQSLPNPLIKDHLTSFQSEKTHGWSFSYKILMWNLHVSMNYSCIFLVSSGSAPNIATLVHRSKQTGLQTEAICQRKKKSILMNTPTSPQSLSSQSAPVFY